MSDMSLPINYVRLSARPLPLMRMASLPRWLCAVQAIVGYEWLVSGLNKVLNAGFAERLPLLLQQGMHDNPYAWYVTFMRTLVLPHSVQYASALAWGDTGIGVVLLLGALLWATQPASRLTALIAWVAGLALVAATALSLNDYLLAGNGLPWIDPAQAYEGMQLAALMPLIAVALLGANVSALRNR